jgi:hypothetical protein
MRKFFESGAGFIVVALICIASGLINLKAGRGILFIAIGGFWLVMAMIVRARTAKKQRPADKS